MLERVPFMQEQETPVRLNPARRLLAGWLFGSAAAVALVALGSLPLEAAAVLLLLPLAGFTAADMIGRPLAWRLAAVLALGLAHALLPGVAAVPAAVMLCLLVWSGLDVVVHRSPLRRDTDADARRLRWIVAAVLVLGVATLPAPPAVHWALELVGLALLSAAWLGSRRLAVRRGARLALGLAAAGAAVEAALHQAPDTTVAAAGALALLCLLTWAMHAVRA
jgi:hypothetical protein